MEERGERRGEGGGGRRKEEERGERREEEEEERGERRGEGRRREEEVRQRVERKRRIVGMKEMGETDSNEVGRGRRVSSDGDGSSSLSPPHRRQSSSVQMAATALSDTEVEVKDRLSSKLWEWSASNKQPPEREVGGREGRKGERSERRERGGMREVREGKREEESAAYCLC